MCEEAARSLLPRPGGPIFFPYRPSKRGVLWLTLFKCERSSKQTSVEPINTQYALSFTSKIVLAHIVSEEEVAGCVSTFLSLVASLLLLFHFHSDQHYLRFDPAASVWAVCSAVWHWCLLASRCRWTLSCFCASWLVSSAQRLFSWCFRALRRSWSLHENTPLHFSTNVWLNRSINRIFKKYNLLGRPCRFD